MQTKGLMSHSLPSFLHLDSANGPAKKTPARSVGPNASKCGNPDDELARASETIQELNDVNTALVDQNNKLRETNEALLEKAKIDQQSVERIQGLVNKVMQQQGSLVSQLEQLKIQAESSAKECARTKEDLLQKETELKAAIDKLPFDNIILATDSYKVSHYRQYPPATAFVYSYFESRGGTFDEVCFFGLQYFIKRYLTGQVVTQKMIDDARELLGNHMGPDHFNEAGWRRILDVHGGKLPIEIKAVPEGTIVPVKNVLFTLVNTDPECFWLTNYLETLLVEVWYPMTVATQSRAQKKLIYDAYMKTCPKRVNGINFKLHDFGYRGVSSVESAAIGGAAHLVSFHGTDTMAGLLAVDAYYGGATVPSPANPTETIPVAGMSIPAAEHSTITSWGRDGEKDAFQNMLTQYPDGLVAVVSDSYNVFNAIMKLWGDELKETVKNRKGTLVIRPDSGDPATIVPQLLDLIGEAFEENLTTVTGGDDQEYWMLPDCVRMIQGDGISYNTLQGIINAMTADPTTRQYPNYKEYMPKGSDGQFTPTDKYSDEDSFKHEFELALPKDEEGNIQYTKRRWAIDNVAFGSGGALLQKVNRDTQKCAFKCSEIQDENEKTTDVYKDPITDAGKKSKKGRLTLERDADGHIVTVTNGKGRPDKDMLQTVFKNGELLIDYTFSDIRKRAAIEGCPTA